MKQTSAQKKWSRMRKKKKAFYCCRSLGMSLRLIVDVEGAFEVLEMQLMFRPFSHHILLC